MRSIWLKSLAGAGFLILTLTASAQDRDRDRDRDRDDDSYHSDRDGRFRDERWRGHLFERVREDVEHVRAVTWPRGDDQYRLGRTMEELNELQGKLANGVFDRHELDDVIGALARVVRDNRMAPRDRDILADDLGRLREYREHHEGWGR
jgi:hypothetical protein